MKRRCCGKIYTMDGKNDVENQNKQNIVKEIQ